MRTVIYEEENEYILLDHDCTYKRCITARCYEKEHADIIQYVLNNNITISELMSIRKD